MAYLESSTILIKNCYFNNNRKETSILARRPVSGYYSYEVIAPYDGLFIFKMSDLTIENTSFINMQCLDVCYGSSLSFFKSTFKIRNCIFRNSRVINISYIKISPLFSLQTSFNRHL